MGMTPLLVIIIKLPPANSVNKCKSGEISAVANISEERSAVGLVGTRPEINFYDGFYH